MLLVGLDEAPSGTREYYRAALGNIYGDSPFAQPPLKVVEVGLQVTDERRRDNDKIQDTRFYIRVSLAALPKYEAEVVGSALKEVFLAYFKVLSHTVPGWVT